MVPLLLLLGTYIQKKSNIYINVLQSCPNYLASLGVYSKHLQSFADVE